MVTKLRERPILANNRLVAAVQARIRAARFIRTVFALLRRHKTYIPQVLGSLKPDPYEKIYPQVHTELQKLIRLFDSSRDVPEVLCFGDSVFLRISRDDSDLRTLDEMIHSHLEGRLRVVRIALSACRIKVFYYFIRVLETMKQRPRIVVLPINMRLFSPQWDLNPEMQFDQEIQVLQCCSDNPEGGIAAVNDASESSVSFEVFDAISVDYPLTPFTRIGEFRLIINSRPKTEVQRRFRLKQIFIYHYMHQLSLSHPELALLSDTLELLNKMGVAVLVCIIPINYQAGQKYVGREFLRVLESNVNVISDCVRPYQAMGRVCLLDCSTLLTSKYFFHESSATEHLNQKGRQSLAETISRALTQLYCAADRDPARS